MNRADGKGNIERTQQLYAQYGGVIYDRCLRMLASPQEAEDALQETFIRVMRFLSGFRYGDDELPWLYRIATNVCLTLLRKRSGRREQLLGAKESKLVARVPTPSGEVEARRLLQRLSSQLSRAELELLVACYVDGMDQGQAAMMLGVSRRTVVRRLARVRRVIDRMQRDSPGRKGSRRNGAPHSF